ncbi:nicotinate-nucleotide adenylyltransferase [Methylobacter sp. BBA5.1]|uniref:nicotinate-nucleotide adenylyltransferase n=1 Tax=Methylobacter sp. BBA5.1 TaxID=1495064 RepID=UPI00056C36E8|nr:nicotinate-nucleotide adenylyltransferase [Methylobacter sp. BBA5.1]
MIGILGGTFDPVHYGHLRPALEVREVFGLTEIRLLPSAHPPHREQPVATALMRARMLELAIQNQSGFVIDTRELDRAGRSYMIDTLKSFRLEFPEQTLILFVGADAFKNLTNWHCWQQLFDYAHIVVMTRPGVQLQELDGYFAAKKANGISELTQEPAGKLFFQPVTQLEISATAIRQMIAEKHNPGFLLPDAVIEYIKQHKLYES